MTEKIKRALIVTTKEDAEKAENNFMGELSWVAECLSADITYSLLLIRKPWIPICCYPEGTEVVFVGRKTQNGRHIKGLPAENSFRIVGTGLIGMLEKVLGKIITSFRIPLPMRSDNRKPHPTLKIEGLQSFLSVYFEGSAIFIGRYLHSDDKMVKNYTNEAHQKLARFYNKWSPKMGSYLASQIGEIKYGNFSKHHNGECSDEKMV